MNGYSPAAYQPQFRGLYGVIVEELGRFVVSGQIGADAPIDLPKVAEYFDASRTVIREALRALETKGVVERRPGADTRARPISHWNLFDPDVLRWCRSAATPGLREHQAAFLVALQQLRDLEPELKQNIYFDALMRGLETTATAQTLPELLHEHQWPTPDTHDPLAKSDDCSCGMSYANALKAGLVGAGERRS